MCRWAAYIGKPILLNEIISHPEHSLIQQSMHATYTKSSTNADGFGVAWYGDHPEPALFRDILPAWSDRNLRSVAEHVRSGLFLSHVRASSGAPTSRENCHPFAVANWSFVHNGEVGGFGTFRHRTDKHISDALFRYREGTTDSEALFLLALGHGLKQGPKAALERAAGQLQALSREFGTKPHLHMSVAFSCGKCLYVARYSSEGTVPTIYHRWSDELQGRAVVSEPLNLQPGWEELPAGSFCVFKEKTFEILPFVPAI